MNDRAYAFRSWRAKHGLSALQAATLMGITEDELRASEKGLDAWRVKVASRIDAVLKIDASMPPVQRFTSAQAAQALLDRHARTLAELYDAENLHSAEDHMKMTARAYLQLIIDTDAGA